MSEGSPPPREARYMQAFREDGSVVYAGWMDEDLDTDFYTNGHPNVHGFKLTRYELVESRNLDVRRTPEAIAAWHERTGRA